MKTLFLCGLIILFSNSVFAGTCSTKSECPICGESYTEYYDCPDGDAWPTMPTFSFPYYERSNIDFEMEQPACPKCREKYQLVFRSKMIQYFKDLVDEIKDENANLRAINQEINKSKEIKRLENEIKRLQGEVQKQIEIFENKNKLLNDKMVEEEYTDLTWDGIRLNDLSDTDTTIYFDPDNIEGQDRQ